MSTDKMLIAGLLKQNPMFSSLSGADLSRLLPGVRIKRYDAGAPVFTAGEPGTDVFIVKSGTLQLLSGRGVMAKLTAGEMAGEESVLEAETYVLSGVAEEPLEVLAVARDGLKKLTAGNSGVQMKMFSRLLGQLAGSAGVLPGPQPDGGREPLRQGVIWGWLALILVPLGVMVFGPALGLDLNSRLFLSTFSAVIVMWIFRLTPGEFIPCLLGVVAVVFMGLAPVSVVLSGFASGSFFMALSVFGLGAVLMTSGVSYRLTLIVLKKVPQSGIWYSFSVFAAGLLMTPVVPTPTGRVALISPLLLDMGDALAYQPGGRPYTQLAVAAFAGVTSFSTIFLSGSPFNFLIFGLLPSQVRGQFGWGNWLAAAAATGLVMFILSLLGIYLMFRHKERPVLSKGQIDAQLSLLGPVTEKEWTALGGIFLFVLGLFAATSLKIDTPWIGLAVLYVFLAMGVLDKEEFHKNINWPFLVYLGGLIGLINTLSYLGIDRWAGSHLNWLGNYMQHDFVLFVLMISLGIVLIQLVIPYGTAVTLFASIFIPMAAVTGVSAWLVGFIILFMADGWGLPYQASTYLYFRDNVNKPAIYQERGLLLFNAMSVFIRLAAVLISLPVWKYMGLF